MPSPHINRSRLPVVALVGRANVGKSTLWNKLVGGARALVSPEAHTTRDRNFARATWRGRELEIVDTGGLDVETNEIGQGIKRQSEYAIKHADAVVFLVDGKTGVLPEDREIAKTIRKLNKRVILAVNKIDAPKDLANANERAVYGLGLGEPLAVSASTGKGVGDLLDRVFEVIPKEVWANATAAVEEKAAKEEQEADEKDVEVEEPEHIEMSDESAGPELIGQKGLAATEEPKRPLRLVIMGRPNAGKSSLVNAILGEERVIVSAIAHTTREPQDTHLSYKGQEFVLVDTAGMRKRARVERGLEEEGLEKNRNALDNSDIAVLVFDATEDPRTQDKRLAGLMKDANKGLILVANKWDLVEGKTTKSTDEYEHLLRYTFPFLSWAPMMFISAKTGQRARNVLDTALVIQKERERKIEYNALNKFLKTVLKQKKPMQSYGPKSPYIHDVAQVGIRPPTFLFTIRGEKESIHPSWLKFFEKKLRDKFGYEGTPIHAKAVNVPVSKSERDRNVRGPGMESVAGKITEKWMTAKKKNVRWRP